MKKLLMLSMLILVGACAGEQVIAQPAAKEVYPYNMTEKEWNNLSIKDQTKMRRDFYFYEKGEIKFVDPTLEVEGKEEPSSWKKN